MASRSLGTLTLDLVVRMGGFVAGMGQAERKVDTFARNAQRKISGLGKAIGTALGVSIAGALTGIVTGVSNAIDRMDELRDASIRLGVGVETLSAYSFAAEQLGTDIDALGKGFKILAKNIADSAEGKGKAPVFAALGISLKDAEGNLRSLEDVIPDIANAFKQLEDGTQKAALAQELFGKSGLDLIEFLNQGEEGLKAFTDKARELGLVIDQDAADKADEFNDLLAEMKATFSGLATEIGIALLPTLIDLTKEFLNFIQDGDNADRIAYELQGTLKGLAEIAGGVVGIFKVLGATFRGVAADLNALDQMGDATQKLFRLDIEGARESVARAREFRAEAAKASDEIGEILESSNKLKAAIPKTPLDGMFTIPGARNSFSAVPLTPQGGWVSASGGVDRKALGRALGGITTPTGGAGRKGGGGGKSDAEKDADALKEAYDRLNESMGEQIALFGKTSEEAKLRYDLEHGELAKLSEEQKASLILQAQKIDSMRAEKEVADELASIEKQRQDSFETVMGDIRDEYEQLGLNAEAQDTLNKLKYAGVTANDAYGQSIIAANEALWKQKDAVGDQIEAMDALRDAGRGIFDDLYAGVGIWDALKNAADDFAATLFRIVANNLVERALGQQGSSSGGSGGGWIANILGAFFGAKSGGSSSSSAGSFLNAFSSGSYAIGGVGQPGGLYRINENGPEIGTFGGHDYMLVGRQPVTVSPMTNGGRRGARGGDTYVMNFPPAEDRRAATAVRARVQFQQQYAKSRND